MCNANVIPLYYYKDNTYESINTSNGGFHLKFH